MIVCPGCGKENQDHYKFCLGCGAELPALESLIGVAPTQAPIEAHDALDAMVSRDEAVGYAAARPAAAGPPLSSVGSAAAANAPSSAPCPQCGAHNPTGFHFCGSCGQRLIASPAAQAPGSAAEAATPAAAQPEIMASLSLIRPDGTPDGSHDLHEPEVIVGRGSGPLFEQDAYLSPHHARFYREGNSLLLEDIGSLNGVFVRIDDQEPLEDGDVFRLGQELLRFDAIGPPRVTEDGTQILGSPNPGYWGRLSLVVGEGVDGSAFPLMGEEMVLGRERGDILFSDDGYVSATHAKIVLTQDGSVCLVDLGSSNGTFIKLREPRPVFPGTYVLMGQQLFRVEA